MKTIFKYKVFKGTMLRLPLGYKVVHVDFQDGEMTLWVEQNTDNTKYDVYFEVFGTGWEIPGDMRYVGTAISLSGFVWHVYKAI